MWVYGFRLSQVMIRKSFCSSATSNNSRPNVYAYLRLCLILSTTHLFSFKFNSHVFDQTENWCRSYWRASQSANVEIFE